MFDCEPIASVKDRKLVKFSIYCHQDKKLDYFVFEEKEKESEATTQNAEKQTVVTLVGGNKFDDVVSVLSRNKVLRRFHKVGNDSDEREEGERTNGLMSDYSIQLTSIDKTGQDETDQNLQFSLPSRFELEQKMHDPGLRITCLEGPTKDTKHIFLFFSVQSKEAAPWYALIRANSAKVGDQSSRSDKPAGSCIQLSEAPPLVAVDWPYLYQWCHKENVLLAANLIRNCHQIAIRFDGIKLESFISKGPSQYETT